MLLILRCVLIIHFIDSGLFNTISSFLKFSSHLEAEIVKLYRTVNNILNLETFGGKTCVFYHKKQKYR